MKSREMLVKCWRFIAHTMLAFMVINGVLSVWEVSAQSGPSPEPDFWKVFALVGFGLIGTAIFRMYTVMYRQGKELTKLTARIDNLCVAPGKACEHHEAFKQKLDGLVGDFDTHEKEHAQRMQRDLDELRKAAGDAARKQ